MHQCMRRKNHQAKHGILREIVDKIYKNKKPILQLARERKTMNEIIKFFFNEIKQYMTWRQRVMTFLKGVIEEKEKHNFYKIVLITKSQFIRYIGVKLCMKLTKDKTK